MEAETCKRELVIEIPPDVVQRKSESIAAEYARKARVPGFRPGRVPRELILRRFRDAIREEVAQALLPQFFTEAVKEQDLSVAGEPRFENLKFEDEQPLTATATFEVYPPIELSQYAGLEVTEEESSVTDADVDRAVESLRHAAAAYEVIEGRGAEDGDLLSVNYEGRDAKSSKRLVEIKEGTVRLGAEGTSGAFTDNLRGSQAGDVREFEAAYPADFPREEIAGKILKIRVEVLSVKRAVLPSADDELAKSVSRESTLEALRTALRKEIEERRRRDTEIATKRKLLDILIAQQRFPLPETLVEERIDRKIRQVAGRLAEQGVDPHKAKVDWQKLRHELRAPAENDVRGDLLLEKIAEAEKIEISEEELDESIRQLAADDESPAALKSRLTRNGGLARLQSSRRNQKVLDFIYHNAKVIRQLSLV